MAAQYAPVGQDVDTSYPPQQRTASPTSPSSLSTTNLSFLPILLTRSSSNAYLTNLAPMSYHPQTQEQPYTSPNPNMDWHAQIAETDDEVKQERFEQCCPCCNWTLEGCCTCPSMPSCSCEKGCCDWLERWTDWCDAWERVCWPFRCLA